MTGNCHTWVNIARVDRMMLQAMVRHVLIRKLNSMLFLYKRLHLLSKLIKHISFHKFVIFSGVKATRYCGVYSAGTFLSKNRICGGKERPWDTIATYCLLVFGTGIPFVPPSCANARLLFYPVAKWFMLNLILSHVNHNCLCPYISGLWGPYIEPRELPF